MKKLILIGYMLLFMVAFVQAKSYSDNFNDGNCIGWLKITGESGATCDASSFYLQCSGDCSSGWTGLNTNMLITEFPINITEDWTQGNNVYAVIGVRNYTTYDWQWTNGVIFHVPTQIVYIYDAYNTLATTCSGVSLSDNYPNPNKATVIYKENGTIEAWWNGVLQCSVQTTIQGGILYPYTMLHGSSPMPNADNFYVQFGESNTIRQSNPEVFEYTSSSQNDYLGMEIYVNSTSDFHLTNVYFDEGEGSSRVCLGDDTPYNFNVCKNIVNNVASFENETLLAGHYYQLITDSSGSARVSRFKSVGVSYPANSVETYSPIMWITARVGTYGDYTTLINSTWAWNIKALDVEEVPPTPPSRDAKRIYNFNNMDEEDTGTDLIDGNAYGTPPFDTGDFGGNIRLTQDINSQGFDIPLGDLTYDETNDFTLQFLYKVNTEGTGISNLQFAPYYYGLGDLYYIFQYDGSVYKFQVQDTLNYVNIPMPDLGDGQWHLITLEQSATDGKIYAYVDKTKYEASINYAGSPISEKWTFARNYYTGSPFDESFDNIKIFGVALTDQEVNATYDAYFPPCTPDWSCIGYETCVEPMVNASCNSVVDLNTCGDGYGGNYSEFTPQTCSYPPPITGYVPYHNATDIPAVVIDFITEYGIQMIVFAGLIALLGLGIWILHVI